MNWTPHEIEIINRYQLLTAKPCVFLINLSKRDYLRKQNRHLPRIQELVQTRFMGEPMIPFSVEFEQEMFDMEQNEGLEAVQAYYQANPRHKSMMKKVLKTGMSFCCCCSSLLCCFWCCLLWFLLFLLLLLLHYCCW